MSLISLNTLSYKKGINSIKTINRYILPVLFFSLFLLIHVSNKAYGENWVLFYNSQDEEKYYFDKDSIQKPQKDIIQVWQKRAKVEDEVEQDIEKIHLELDCKKRQYRILSVIDANSKTQEPAREDEITSGVRTRLSSLISILGALFENVCR